MKKLVCTIMLALMTAISATASASEGITYKPGDENSVTVADAENKNTVLVKNKTTGEIVYVNQTDAEHPYTAATEFLLKAKPGDGAYTIQFNGTKAKTFYIGMAGVPGDVQLTQISTDGERENSDGTKSVGYIANDVTGTFSGVIIKIDDKYYGAKLNTDSLIVSGAAIGLQINGITTEDPTVWLTSRDFDASGAEYGTETE